MGKLLQKLPWLAFGVLIVGVVGISFWRIKTQVVVGERSAVSASQKATPAVKIEAEIKEDVFQVGEKVTLLFGFVPQKDILQAKAELESSGVVEVVGKKSFSWGEVENGRKVFAKTAIYIKEEGEGKISGRVAVIDKNGREYGQRKEIYFLATSDRVYFNDSSPLRLRLEYLADLYNQGKISHQEYQKRKEKILGGGAREESWER